MGEAEEEGGQGIGRPGDSQYVASSQFSTPMFSYNNSPPLDAEAASVQSSFALKFSSGLWLLTTGLQFFIGWWYRRQAVFYLPNGWFGPLEWWLALPFAPKGTLRPLHDTAACYASSFTKCSTCYFLGSVSCATWQMACKRTIRLLEGLIRQAILEREW